MDNFVFKVYDIRSAGDEFSLFRGKHYSGTVKQNEKIRFAGRAGGFDNLIEGVTETSIGSFNPSPILDCIVMDTPYSGEPYDAKDKHMWIIDAENNPSMVVEDTFNISGRGIVVTGVIASGTIKVGDEMAIVTPDGIVKSVVVTGIEYFQKLLDIANEGDNVGVLLRGIKDKSEIPIGSLLCGKLTMPKPETSMVNKDTALIVNDIFDITGHGIVVTGKVLSDHMRTGDIMQFAQGNGVIRNVVVSGIERNRQLCNEAKYGDIVGVFLKGLRDKNEISIGTQLRIKEHSQVTQSTSSVTHKKVALLIGNCNYGGNAQLRNCINDANALGEKLNSLGFETIIVEDGNKEEIDIAINQFSMKARNADAGFVFYSGHGMQYNGENYMIPIGATLSSPADIDYRCNRASYALSKMEDVGCKLKILVLDACRTNPFTKGWYKGDMQEGLGVMGAPSGTIVAFATSPNSVASDGYANGNSPYTIALLKLLEESTLDIVTYFNKVSSYVYKITNNQQNPWFSCSALTGDFYLAKK